MNYLMEGIEVGEGSPTELKDLKILVNRLSLLITRLLYEYNSAKKLNLKKQIEAKILWMILIWQLI